MHLIMYYCINDVSEIFQNVKVNGVREKPDILSNQPWLVTKDEVPDPQSLNVA